jgi:short-subunit dehydrogenase
MEKLELSGKVALVTGASSGIGLAVARRLVEAGVLVAMVARHRKRLEAAAAELGDRARAFPADVTDFAALDALPGRVVKALGSLDILVNNAGVNHRGPVATRTGAELTEIVTTNLTAPIYLTRACLEHLRPGSAIVNIASLAGMVPVPEEGAYSASKAGLRAFSRVLRGELGERGIRVSSVCPGPVDTNFFSDVEKVPDLVFSQPMSSADDIAEVVLACIRKGTAEVAVPALSGKLVTVGYLFPGFMKAVRPLLERRGAAAKARYLARKRP